MRLLKVIRMPESRIQNDILGDILNDPQTGKIRGLDGLNQLIRGEASSPTEQNPPLVKTKKKIIKTSKKCKKKQKKKSTHYLSKEVFENLDEVKKDIRDMLPVGKKLQATKSKIVEKAVKMVLKEFCEKGENSFLVEELDIENKNKGRE